MNGFNRQYLRITVSAICQIVRVNFQRIYHFKHWSPVGHEIAIGQPVKKYFLSMAVELCTGFLQTCKSESFRDLSGRGKVSRLRVILTKDRGAGKKRARETQSHAYANFVYSSIPCRKRRLLGTKMFSLGSLNFLCRSIFTLPQFFTLKRIIKACNPGQLFHINTGGILKKFTFTFLTQIASIILKDTQQQLRTKRTEEAAKAK